MEQWLQSTDILDSLALSPAKRSMWVQYCHGKVGLLFLHLEFSLMPIPFFSLVRWIVVPEVLCIDHFISVNLSKLDLLVRYS